jgi:hypothetical protein
LAIASIECTIAGFIGTLGVSGLLLNIAGIGGVNLKDTIHAPLSLNLASLQLVIPSLFFKVYVGGQYSLWETNEQFGGKIKPDFPNSLQ